MSCHTNTPSIQQNFTSQRVSKKSKQYALRECSIQKRKETEKNKNQPKKRGPKPRPKTLPMSKYRRKTANLRERMRMGEINVAFENLRQKLFNPMQMAKGKCEKLTKINILHVAINYIRAMENLLETGDSKVTSFSEMTKNPLRDESESKMEMQKILNALMKKAEAKAALENVETNPQQTAKGKSKKNRDENHSNTENSNVKIENFDTAEDHLNHWPPPNPLYPGTSTVNKGPTSKSTVMKTDKKVFVSSPPYSFVTLDGSDLTMDTMDLLLNMDPTLNMFEHSGDDFLKDLFVDIAEIVKTLPENEFEDNLEMFL